MQAPELPDSSFASRTGVGLHGERRNDAHGATRDLVLYDIYVEKIAANHIEPGVSLSRSAPVQPWQSVQ